MSNNSVLWIWPILGLLTIMAGNCCMFFRDQRNTCSGELTSLSKCNRNIENHLQEIRQTNCTVKSERDLLLARHGVFDTLMSQTVYSVCEQHRNLFGVSFVKHRGCQHPSHKEKNRRAKADLGRTVSLEMSKDIHDHWQTIVPLGEGNYTHNSYNFITFP